MFPEMCGLPVWTPRTRVWTPDLDSLDKIRESPGVRILGHGSPEMYHFSATFAYMESRLLKNVVVF